MTEPTEPRLDRADAAAILAIPIEKVSAIKFLRPHNHTWRIVAGGATYFLKAHTKDWYDANPASATPVRHEVTGHRTLRAAGLATAEVIAYSTDTDNPIHWPYLVTRELPGTPLADLLPMLPRTAAHTALKTAGRYLASMHQLTYDQPGYLIDGPPTQPAPNQWLHWLSKPERFLLYLFENLTADAAEVDLATRDAAAGLVERTLPKLRPAFQPLSFVHGDCHANVFYLDHDDDTGWRVTGIIDMENCSSGSPAFDFVKLFIELAGRMHPTTSWWEPLFDGYQTEPEFDLMRVLLIGHAHINYACLGNSLWPTDRQSVLRRILTARNWSELFGQEQIRAAVSPTGAELT